MKKVFSVLTVAVLAVSTVFAGFSGSFETQYKADFAGENYGFLNGTTNKLELKFDKVLGGTANENPITGKIVAEIAPKVEKGGDINLGLSIKDASITGENWSVNLVKMAGIGDFAAGSVGRYVNDDNPAVTPDLAATVKTTNGVTVDYDGWKFGVGMNFKAAKAAAPVEYAFDGVKEVKKGSKVYTNAFSVDGKIEEVEAANDCVIPVYKLVSAKAADAVKELAATFNMKQLSFLEDSLKLDAYVGGYAAGKKNIDLGFGAKVAFAQDKITADVASDVVVLIKDKTTVEADVAANFAYDFVNASIYYATTGVGLVDDAPAYGGEDLLDIAVGVDLASLNVPLALNFALVDIANENERAIAVDASSAFMEGAKVAASFGTTIVKDAHDWNAAVSGEYTLENIAKFSAGIGLEGGKEVDKVSFNVAAENTTLIENTTLKLAYASANFMDKDAAAGALTASVKVAF